MKRIIACTACARLLVVEILKWLVELRNFWRETEFDDAQLIYCGGNMW